MSEIDTALGPRLARLTGTDMPAATPVLRPAVAGIAEDVEEFVAQFADTPPMAHQPAASSEPAMVKEPDKADAHAPRTQYETDVRDEDRPRPDVAPASGDDEPSGHPPAVTEPIRVERQIVARAPPPQSDNARPAEAKATPPQPEIRGP